MKRRKIGDDRLALVKRPLDLGFLLFEDLRRHDVPAQEHLCESSGKGACDWAVRGVCELQPIDVREEGGELLQPAQLQVAQVETQIGQDKLELASKGSKAIA
ncbi:MAG TPA: hypothetical protein VFB30_13810, partial [Spirochaetia bacterium]|nr:hypothetical protein [Spirochaetia bacterium]